jgi:hypothetical protein
VRKRKHKKELPVYVNFKDYTSKLSRDTYIDYYLFVRGWLEELIDALGKGKSFKRAKRAIDEATMNFEQVISFFNQQGKEKIYPLYKELGEIRKEIEKVPNMSKVKRNYFIRKIEILKREFETNFNYVDAEKWMD